MVGRESYIVSYILILRRFGFRWRPLVAMGRFTAVAILALAGLGVATCRVQLPCDSLLRRFPTLSIFFEHCNCSYGNWSDVMPLAGAPPPAVPVPPEECESGLKIATGVRFQRATDYNNFTCGDDGTGCEACAERREEVYSCVTDCIYETGTEATLVIEGESVRVPSSQCESGYAIPATRPLLAVGGFQCTGTRCTRCENDIEEIYMCKRDF